MDLSTLPTEILGIIGSCCYLPGLMSLSRTNRSLHQITAPILARAQEEHEREFDRDLCVGWEDSDHTDIWHGMLLLVLLHRYPATYIKSIMLDSMRGDLKGVSLRPYPCEDLLGPFDDYEMLIRGAIEASPYILPEERANYLNEVLRGNPDAAFGLFLPMCSNIRTLKPPDYDYPLTFHIVRRVGLAYHDPDHDRRRYPLPFKHLHTIMSLYTHELIHQDHFQEFASAPFISLPPVKRVWLTFHTPFNPVYSRQGDWDYDNWRDDIVRPAAPEVIIRGGGTSAVEIRALAEAWAGPCTFYHIYSPHYDGCSPQYYEWSRCDLSGDSYVDPQSGCRLFTGSGRKLRLRRKHWRGFMDGAQHPQPDFPDEESKEQHDARVRDLGVEVEDNLEADTAWSERYFEAVDELWDWKPGQTISTVVGDW